MGQCEDSHVGSSTPQVDVLLENFMSCTYASGDSHEFGGNLMKQEPTHHNAYSNSSHMLYYEPPQPHQSHHPFLFNTKTSIDCSNLIRQSSSPAGLFSNFNVENGYAEMREMRNYRNGNNGVSNYMDFSNGSSSSSPEDRRMGTDNNNKRSYMSSFLDDSWHNSGLNSLKRSREDDGNMYLGFNSLEIQNGNSRNRICLAHQYNTSSQMASMNKFLQFQGSVPCKIRAKRGFATHPRSIAERERRSRISERMKKLQDVFPNMEKQTNTSDMLDLAVEYIKDLQKHVNTLTDRRDKCMCSYKTKQYSNP